MNAKQNKSKKQSQDEKMQGRKGGSTADNTRSSQRKGRKSSTSPKKLEEQGE